MKVLNPLAILHIGLSARHILHMMSIHQFHFEAALFPNLKQRNPINTGGFHSNSPNPACLKPVGQSL
jgi:hypothetical protein